MDLKGTVPVALTHQDGRLEFGAAELVGEATGRLTGDIRIRYDALALPLQRFSVVGESELTTHVWTRPDGSNVQTGQPLTAPSFPAIDGFIQLDAAGTGTIDTTTVLRLRDPNGRGALTTEDFQFGSADELFATKTPPGANDVRIDLALSSDLLLAGSHGTVVVGTRATTSEIPYAAPVVTRDGALDQLTALTRAQALTGFAKYTMAIRGVEDSVDAELPLLDAKLTDFYSPGNRLLEVLAQQATATITCGAAKTSPPTGAPRPGQVRYCQAITTGLTLDAGSLVVWDSPDADVTVSGPTAGTVGNSPTANVQVSGGGGFPRLTVTFTSDGQTRTARTLVGSIQDLSRAVDELGLGGELTYDSTNQSLEIAVQEDDAAETTVEVDTGGSGNLAPLTGLTGLCQAKAGTTPRVCPRTGDDPEGGTIAAPAAGNADVTTSDREIDATFGIGLVPPVAAPVDGAEAPDEPVTYVKPGTGGLLWRIGSVSAEISENAPMVARIGFLRVDVDITDYDLTTAAESAAAQVTVPTGTVAIAGGTVAGAVDVTRLLGADPAQGHADPVQPTATRALSATADLDVQDSPGAAVPAGPGGTPAASPGVRPVNEEGTIEAAWASLAPHTLPTVTTGGAYDRLRLLDLVPSRQGTMGADTDGTTLVDPGADFYRQFGLDDDSSDADRKVTRQLYDLDPSTADQDATTATKTVCTAFTVDDEHTLECTDGPLAQDGGHLAAGHRYIINGDPEALRDVLIEDLAAVLMAYASPDASLGADRTLPLVDLLPSDISAARTKYSKALVKLQAAATGTSDAADSSDVSTLQGFASAVKKYVPNAATVLSLPTGTSRLILDTSLTTGDETTNAALRVTAGDAEVRAFDGVEPGTTDPALVKVPLKTTSSAALHIAVDLADSSSYVGKTTSVGEKVAGFMSNAATVQDSLHDLATEYGSSEVVTGDADDIEIGIGVRIDTAPVAASPDWIPLADFRGSLDQVRTRNGSAQTCGGATAETAACLELPLNDTTPAHHELTTVNVALGAEDSSGGAGADLMNQPLAFWFLADGLTALNRTLGDSLNGNSAGMSMPLVGTDLDGGADIPSEVTAYTGGVRTALNDLETSYDGGAGIDKTTPWADFDAALTTALNGVTVAGTSHDQIDDATDVELLCDGDPCGDGDQVKDVTEIRAPLTISGSKSDQKSTFQPGLAGIALDTNLEVPTTTAWTLDVTVGIRRGSGPFLLFDPAATDTDVLTAAVTAELPTYSSENCHPWAREGKWEVTRGQASETAQTYVLDNQNVTAECIDAFVGKLPSVLVDRKDNTPADNDPDADMGDNDTGLDATITVALTPGASADDDGRVYLPAIYDKKMGFDTSADGEGGLAVYFESYAADLGFFDVMGTIDLDWKDGEFSEKGIQFNHLQIDAATVYDVLDFGYAKAKKWLAPLNPVIDVLNAPIPVVNDLAQMVGAGPVSLMSILVNQHASMELVANLLEFQQLVARLPGSAGTELVDLGGDTGGAFHVSSSTLELDSCTAAATETGIGTTGRCDEGSLSDLKRQRNGAPPEDPTAGQNIQQSMDENEAYFSESWISVPVLEDANQVFDMLLDSGDATMLYVDLGHIGAEVSMVRSFGPFMIGPVPVTASIGGTVGLDGRMAFGFDTRGLSRQIEQVDPGDVHGLTALSSGKVFADGFYIDDLEKGVDVPEIELTFTIQAGASVSHRLRRGRDQGRSDARPVAATPSTPTTTARSTPTSSRGRPTCRTARSTCRRGWSSSCSSSSTSTCSSSASTRSSTSSAARGSSCSSSTAPGRAQARRGGGQRPLAHHG